MPFRGHFPCITPPCTGRRKCSVEEKWTGNWDPFTKRSTSAVIHLHATGLLWMKRGTPRLSGWSKENKTYEVWPPGESRPRNSHKGPWKAAHSWLRVSSKALWHHRRTSVSFGSDPRTGAMGELFSKMFPCYQGTGSSWHVNYSIMQLCSEQAQTVQCLATQGARRKPVYNGGPTVASLVGLNWWQQKWDMVGKNPSVDIVLGNKRNTAEFFWRVRALHGHMPDVHHTAHCAVIYINATWWKPSPYSLVRVWHPHCTGGNDYTGHDSLLL